MPEIISKDGNRLHIETWGQGTETIVFSHGFLMNRRMFLAQIDRLKDRYRIIAYDHRGHGDSAAYRKPFDIYALMEDGAQVIERCAGGRPVHFIGMSTGGYVATRLMIRRPELLRSVVLIDTGARAEPPEKLRQYQLMLNVVRWLGVRPVLGRALPLLMGEPFRTAPARRAEFLEWRQSILQLDPRSLVAFGHAIFGRDDVTDALRSTRIDALVIVGALDQPTDIATARALAEATSAGDPVVIPGAGHTSPVEEPDAVSNAIERFLGGLKPARRP